MQIKKDYNDYLERYYKAELWMDTPGRKNSEITPKVKEAFLKIMRDLSKILNTMNKLEISYTVDELINGFKE